MAEYVNYNEKEYKVRYQHKRIIKNEQIYSKGGTTIAYISDSRYGSPKPPLLMAEAHCSSKDSYNKKIGRMIALGRLKKIIEIYENTKRII